MPLLAPATTGPKVRSDLDQLQGSWISVAGPREARLLIAGTRYAFEFLGGDIYMGTFDLFPKADPPQMDMRIEEGPDEHKGLLALCIYHVEGDVLRWCPGRPGSTRRPAGVPSVDDDRYNSLVFRHVRRHRGR
jgi:uncharacterized protein (TIGR03067 family)